MKQVVSIRLSPDQIGAVKALAERRRVSQNSIIEEAIALLLATSLSQAETYYDFDKQPHYKWGRLRDEI